MKMEIVHDCLTGKVSFLEVPFTCVTNPFPWRNFHAISDDADLGDQINVRNAFFQRNLLRNLFHQVFCEDCDISFKTFNVANNAGENWTKFGLFSECS